MVYNANMPRGTSPSWQTAANGANPLIPIEIQQDIIANATQMSFVGRMAKRMPMSSQLRQMPVFSTKPTAYFVNGDSGLKQSTTLAWRNVQMTAEEIAVLVPIPVNVVNDINYDIWAKIKPEVEEAIGLALDAAVLFGTNKPASWPTALTTAAIAAGNTVTSGTGLDIAADTNNVLAAVAADGYVPRGIGMKETLVYTFQGLRDLHNGFIFNGNDAGMSDTNFAGQGAPAGTLEGRLFGVKAQSVMNGVFEAAAGAANAVQLIAGDWDQVILGVRQDVTVDFSKDASIFDSNGDLQFNAFQQDGIIGRFVARYGMAVPNPTNRINSTDSTRYPFAVLRASS